MSVPDERKRVQRWGLLTGAGLLIHGDTEEEIRAQMIEGDDGPFRLAELRDGEVVVRPAGPGEWEFAHR